MSYDLVFCRKENKPLDKRSIIDFCKKYPWFTELPYESGKEAQFFYKNEDTGTNFTFGYDKDHTCKNEEVPCTPPGYYPVGLWFNINFIRPSFYAREAMPIVEALCNELDLLIIDPQNDYEKDQKPSPKQYKAEELIKIWEKWNKFGVRKAGIGRIIDYYPREKIHAWWEYMVKKKEIGDELGSAIFVPQIFLCKKKWNKKLYEVITWTDGTPSVFPKSDFVVIFKSLNNTLGPDPKFSSVLVPYSELINKLKPCLEKYASCSRDAYILYPKKQKEALEIFEKFPFDHKRDALRKFVRPTDIMDIPIAMIKKQAWYNRIIYALLLLAIIWVIWSSAGYKSAINKAKDSWRKGDNESIVLYAKDALERAHNDQEIANAHYWAGIGEYRLGNLDLAEEHEKEVLRFDSEYGAAYVTLGAIMNAKGNQKSAWDAAKRAIQLRPDYAWAHNLMGVLFLEDNNIESAIIYFERAVEIDPDQVIFQQNLAQARGLR